MRERIHFFRLRFSFDPELRYLLAANLQLLDESHLLDIIHAHQRFNVTAYFRDSQNRGKKDKNFYLKQVLSEIPDYINSTDKLGFSKDEASDLLIHLLNASPYYFEENNLNILLLKRAIAQEKQIGSVLEIADLKSIKEMIKEAGKNGVIRPSLYAFAQARRIGLTVEESTKLIMNFPKTDADMAAYTFVPFNNALSSLLIAEVDPLLVNRIFTLIGNKPPNVRLVLYQILEHLIIFKGPANNISPQELLQELDAHLRDGEEIEKVLKLTLSAPKKLKAANEIFTSIQEELDQYFINKPKPLEFAALPYKTYQDLNSGIDNLKVISKGKLDRWETIGEGMWVFDPSRNIWYSLGGKNEILANGIRYYFIPFDLAKLSETPNIFHIHPEDLEFTLKHPFSEFPAEMYQNHVIKFLSATPGRADYDVVADAFSRATSEIRPRSFIIHSLGITEFIYPSNIEQLNEMSIKFREIKDQVLLNIDWQLLLKRGKVIDVLTMTKILIDQLNKLLPPGFAIKFYPQGSGIDNNNL